MRAQRVPARLGKYRIDGVLGQGAMGTVYRGYDPAIDRPVALKTVHPHLLGSEDVDEYVRRFQQEARAAARCDHPNIVRIYDVGVDEGTPFMAMEFVEGRSLKSCLARHERFRADDAAAVMLQILAGLQHAHEQGVVHRDIKPPNILVLLSGTAKLTDFGVARIDSTQATQLGAVLGTPAYMAPEQLLGRPVTAASDLYSVGVVLAELVSGIRPQPGAARALLAELRRGQPVVLADGFLKVLERALSEQPEARFPSARDMAAAIEHSLDDRTATDLMSGLTPCKADDPTTLGELPPAPTANAQYSWAPEVLATVERELADVIGPMARILVRRHAADAKDLSDLSEKLAAHVADEADRKRFLRRFRGGGAETGLFTAEPTTASGGGPAATSAGRVAPGTLTLEPGRAKALERQLAEHVGPMSKVLIRAALASADSIADLYARLAERIPDPAERRAFLASLPPD